MYPKFLDQVEKDDVEKITFSPDGKRAVGTDKDGLKFIVDIPNDPNLLSSLVKHDVEINVAPINNNGAISRTGSASLVIPESDTDKLLQTFVLPLIGTSLIYGYPIKKLLFPSKEDREASKKKSLPGGRVRGQGPLGRGRGGRRSGGLDPEVFIVHFLSHFSYEISTFLSNIQFYYF